MATPHADFQAKRCSDGPGNPKTVRVWVCGALPITLPADACTASKGLQMGYKMVRGREAGAASWLAPPKPSQLDRPKRLPFNTPSRWGSVHTGLSPVRDSSLDP
jgi:hypothetical protein